VLFAATLLAGMQNRRWELADDAFITFRVAEHLASGHGLRFNAGGPRVEAASSLLQVLLLGGAVRAGASALSAALILGVAASALALVLLALALGRRLGAIALWAPLALAGSGAFGLAAVSGLETPLAGLLLLGALLVLPEVADGRSRRWLPAGLLLALLSLCRPEGPLYLLAVLAALLRWPASTPASVKQLGRRGALGLAGWFAALYAPALLLRLLYFRDLLPNAFHAKQLRFLCEAGRLESGLAYLWVTCLREPLLPCALVAGLVLHAARPSLRLRAMVLALLAQLLFLLLSGGDWPHMFGQARFAVPALPLALCVLAEAGCHLAAAARRPSAPSSPPGLAVRLSRLAVPGGALLLLLLSQLDLLALGPRLPPSFEVGPAGPRLTRQSLARALAEHRERPAGWLRRATEPLRPATYRQNFEAQAGRWVRERYGPLARVASIQAGQFAYWSGQPFFDLFGVATPEVARLRTREPAPLARLLLAFDPRVIAFYKPGAGVHHRPLVAAGELWRAGYRPGLLLHDPDGAGAFVLFEKGAGWAADPRALLLGPRVDPATVPPDRRVALRTPR